MSCAPGAAYHIFKLHISAVPTPENVSAGGQSVAGDRKSTRLNSSHLVISYAVFCLKKKNKDTNLAAMYNAQVYPIYVLVDREGNIAAEQQGAAGERAIRRMLRRPRLESVNQHITRT